MFFFNKMALGNINSPMLLCSETAITTKSIWSVFSYGEIILSTPLFHIVTNQPVLVGVFLAILNKTFLFFRGVDPVTLSSHVENGDPVTLSSPRRRGSSKYNPSRFPPARE
ncbi:MAG: hypothetical protein SFT93_05265 [Rickettsiaceae bacterium]|nr:hypothetical protein [Rickettsiaceae bacterium]